MNDPYANSTKNKFILRFFGFIEEAEESEEVDQMMSLAHDISNTYIWVLFAIGVPANILTIITAITMQTISSATLLVAVLAAFDGTSLIAKLTGHQMVRNHVYIGDFGCKFEFVIISVSTLANWVLVLVCAERFVAVCYNAKKKVIFTIRNCLIVLAWISGFVFTLFGAIAIPMRGSILNGLRCNTYQEFQWFWIHVWYWVNASFYLFLPASAIIPMTAKMVWTLHGRIQQGKINNEKGLGNGNDDPNLEPTSEAGKEQDENEGGFTLMIILAAVLFVVLCLPACIYYLAYRRSEDSVTEAHWELFNQAQYVLADSTHVINFFLYAASSKGFRSQLVKLITCKPCRNKSQTAVLAAA